MLLTVSVPVMNNILLPGKLRQCCINFVVVSSSLLLFRPVMITGHSIESRRVSGNDKKEKESRSVIQCYPYPCVSRVCSFWYRTVCHGYIEGPLVKKCQGWCSQYHRDPFSFTPLSNAFHWRARLCTAWQL